MFLPLYAAYAGIILLVIFSFLCGFTPTEQLTDIKPVLFYALFLYMIGIFTGLSSFFSGLLKPEDFAKIFYPGYKYALYIVRLFLIMQLSAFFFRTTTSIEIKEALCAGELYIRSRIQKLPFTKNISLRPKLGTGAALMMSFIPALFELWNDLNRSYRARGGKKGLKKIRVLLVALIALSFHYAHEKAKALAAREVI
jgi:energy-coupling factor transporter transmembrane protein EcfT